MSFLSILKTIETDVTKGLEIAAPIVGTFVPAAGPILVEIGNVLAALEGINSPATPAQLSQVVQAVATTSAVKQHVAAVTAGTAAVPASSPTT
jgi:hypothetical protein